MSRHSRHSTKSTAECTCESHIRVWTKENYLSNRIFEFFISVNCGLITYMLVNKETRGKGKASMIETYSRPLKEKKKNTIGLARKLLNQAVEELDNIARTQCSLAGCNAIFLETNSSIKVSKDKVFFFFLVVAS